MPRTRPERQQARARFNAAMANRTVSQKAAMASVENLKAEILKSVGVDPYENITRTIKDVKEAGINAERVNAQDPRLAKKMQTLLESAVKLDEGDKDKSVVNVNRKGAGRIALSLPVFAPYGEGRFGEGDERVAEAKMAAPSGEGIAGKRALDILLKKEERWDKKVDKAVGGVKAMTLRQITMVDDRMS